MIKLSLTSTPGVLEATLGLRRVLVDQANTSVRERPDGGLATDRAFVTSAEWIENDALRSICDYLLESGHALGLELHEDPSVVDVIVQIPSTVYVGRPIFTGYNYLRGAAFRLSVDPLASDKVVDDFFGCRYSGPEKVLRVIQDRWIKCLGQRVGGLDDKIATSGVVSDEIREALLDAVGAVARADRLLRRVLIACSDHGLVERQIYEGVRLRRRESDTRDS